MVKIIEKPWGHEEIWANTDKYVGKILFIKKGHKLSLQYHNVKDETIRVLKGVLTFSMGNYVPNLLKKNIAIDSYQGEIADIVDLEEGETLHTKRGMIHRMEAKYGDVTVLEVSTPELDDVVRIADDYSRV